MHAKALQQKIERGADQLIYLGQLRKFISIYNKSDILSNELIFLSDEVEIPEACSSIWEINNIGCCF